MAVEILHFRNGNELVSITPDNGQRFEWFDGLKKE